MDKKDIAILRELGAKKCEIGSLPVQKKKFDMWGQLNKLQRVRPMVWINEIPWGELESGSNELKILCEDITAKGIESALRMELYQWSHFPCDMVVEPVIYSGITGGPCSSYADYGIKEDVHRADDGCDVGYIPVIRTIDDADRIRTPDVWFDREATREHFELLCKIFDGVIPVRKKGIVHQWHSPWDQLIHWYGIEQLYMDMYEKPELIHRIMMNFMKALNEVLDRQIELGMLDVGNGNWRIGSGGMGITDELPGKNTDGHKVHPSEQWGCCTAQIFSEVSPQMHEEFALGYERPLMERFGLSYYGCCEPLHKKIDMLKSVKNLRKISMSPWINIDEASEIMGADYVFSFKPNPAHLAMDTLNENELRQYIRDVIGRTRKNRCEIILKDITTVKFQPLRLDKWAQIVMDEVER